MQEFFSFNFPLRDFFFVLRPPPTPPPPHKFSNGPSLTNDFDDAWAGCDADYAPSFIYFRAVGGFVTRC